MGVRKRFNFYDDAQEMVMEKHLQESLDLITKELDEADPDEFLEDFLKFQEQSEGGMTVDELIATFDISV